MDPVTYNPRWFFQEGIYKNGNNTIDKMQAVIIPFWNIEITLDGMARKKTTFRIYDQN